MTQANEVIEALRHRRSVRDYDGTPIDEGTLRLVLEAGLRAPTSRNLQSTELVVVRDPETLRWLSGIRPSGTRMLERAGAAILAVGDTQKSDVWLEDASIALAYIHLAADSLGLGSCWVQMWNREAADGGNLELELRERFAIPERFRPVAFLALGNGGTHPEGHKPDEERLDKLHWESF